MTADRDEEGTAFELDILARATLGIGTDRLGIGQLRRQDGPDMKLSAEHLLTTKQVQMLQRLSRDLRRLHLFATNALAR